MSLTAERQKCSIRTFFKITLSLFHFSLYSHAKYQLKIVYLFDDALLIENNKLDIAFSYAISMDFTLFFYSYLLPISYAFSWVFWVCIVLLIHCIQHIENS